MADTFEYSSDTSRALSHVLDERARQDAKWGNQDHRRDRISASELDVYATERDWCRNECDRHEVEDKANGGASWTDILLEETFEALAESDPVKLRAELVQVAAVAVSWIESIDRRKV